MKWGKKMLFRCLSHQLIFFAVLKIDGIPLLTHFKTAMSLYGGRRQSRYLGCAFILRISQPVPEVWGERRHPFILCQHTQSNLVQVSHQSGNDREKNDKRIAKV